MKKLLLLSLVPFIALGNINQTVEDIDNRLTDIEIKNTQRRIDVGMEMHMIAGYLSTDNLGPNDIKYNEQQMKNNFRLKFSGVLNKHFQAYASIQASYIFNNQVQTRVPDDDDMTSPTRGSRPYIRTAYFDWKFNKNLVLSAGRLPTTSGPPEHMKHGRGRLGTYPLVSFNLPLDGISLTFKTPKINDRTDISLRTIYIHGGVSNQQKPEQGQAYNSSKPNDLANGHDGVTQMIDIQIKPKNKKIFDNMLLIGQYSFLRMGSFQDFTGPGQLLTGQFGITDDKNIYRYEADDKKLADIQIATAYLEVHKLLGTQLDFYFSHMRSWNRPVANINATVLSDGNDAAGTGGTDSMEGQSVDIGKFISKNGDSQGTRTLYGARYNFENSFIGGEYWKTTSFAVPNDLYSDDFIPLGLVAGEIFHVYYTHMFYNNDLSVRLGYQHIDEEKNFGTFFYTDSNQETEVLYTALYVTY